MLVLLPIMLVILAVAGAVMAYVAYPRRGEKVPHVPWLGDALKRSVDSLPTVEHLESRPRRASHH